MLWPDLGAARSGGATLWRGMVRDTGGGGVTGGRRRRQAFASVCRAGGRRPVRRFLVLLPARVEDGGRRNDWERFGAPSRRDGGGSDSGGLRGAGCGWSLAREALFVGVPVLLAALGHGGREVGPADFYVRALGTEWRKGAGMLLLVCVCAWRGDIPGESLHRHPCRWWWWRRPWGRRSSVGDTIMERRVLKHGVSR
jgi:hypothetical protein